MKTYIKILPLFALGFTLLTSSCKKGQEQENNESKINQTNHYEIKKSLFTKGDVTLGTFSSHPFQCELAVTGLVDIPPQNKIFINSYFEGFVKDIFIIPGSKVKRGTLLYILENPDFINIQQDYLETKSQINYLKSEYERQKTLAKDLVASQKTYFKAEADYNSAQVKLASLAKKLLLMQINPNTLTVQNMKSTIDIKAKQRGYITEVTINKGSYIRSSEKTVTMVNPDHLHIELQIFEKDLTTVKEGQPILFHVQNNPSTNYHATVHLINKAINQDTHTISVHGHLQNEQNSDLLPGMYIQATVKTAKQQLLALPETAIVPVNNQYFVLVQKNNTQDKIVFEKKEVTIGSTENGFIAITNASDFDKNTQFLTNGAFQMIKD